VLDVIDLFAQKETIDELGIGSIRDTIADHLSPGTSTVQTRARYFFFIPWMYQALERRRITGASVAKQARAFEVKLSQVLAQSADAQGVIGKQAGASLKRLPSAVYWSGLKRLGFRLFDGSQERYHRIFEAAFDDVARDDASDVQQVDHHLTGSWNPHIPKPPVDFPDGACLDLTRAEAEFFAEHLAFHARESLLHFLVDGRDAGVDVAFPWEHAKAEHMPSPLSTWVRDARCYSLFMHGSALLYNLMLAELRGNEEWLNGYRYQFAEWAASVDGDRAKIVAWDRSAFWSRLHAENPRLPRPARAFSEQWIEAVLGSPSVARLESSSTARQLIDDRERRIKGHRARLHSPAHLELWGGSAGSQRINYRWAITSAVAADIIAGLGR
jgi:hypothetical protein